MSVRIDYLSEHFDLSFRSDSIEPIVSGSLFPDGFSVKEKVENWIRVFSGFDKVEVKALEKILEQKQRFVSRAWVEIKLFIMVYMDHPLYLLEIYAY